MRWHPYFLTCKSKLQTIHTLRAPRCALPQKERYQIYALKKTELKQIDTPALPKEPGLHHDYKAGDRHGNGAIELSTWKTTWIPDT